jgi:Tyrosine phosphatase family
MRASRALLSASLVAQQASALHSFQEVWNFRKLRTQIYRSAALEKATQQDVDALLTKFRIRTIIDLRGEDERVKVAGSWVDTTFAKDDAAAQTSRRLHHVPLLKTERHYRGIYERWPAWKQAQVSAISLVSGRAESSMYIDEINAGGLPLFSEVLLSKGGEDICKVLKLMATPGERSVLCIQCTTAHCIAVLRFSWLSWYSFNQLIFEYFLTATAAASPQQTIIQ